jgi:hypothetical protein
LVDSTSANDPPPKRRGRLLTVVVVAAVAASVVVALLAFVPISHGFSFVVPTNETTSRAYPAGAHVTVYWDSSKSGSSSGLEITEGAGAVLYDQSGAGGTFSFVASGQSYDFSVGSLDWSANVWGSWNAPTI